MNRRKNAKRDFKTYSSCELNAGESKASSMERRGSEATPFGEKKGEAAAHGR